jgi:hypothetical protein
MLRIVLIAVAIGWVIINAWGLIYAVAVDEAPHAGIHILLLLAAAVAARFLWRWKPGKKPQPAQVAGPRTDILADEIDRLQRELDEAQKSRDFAEELLRKRPGPSQPS